MNVVVPMLGTHQVHADAMLHLIVARRDLLDLGQRIASDPGACSADEVVKVLMVVTAHVRAALAFPMGCEVDRDIERVQLRLLHFMAQAHRMKTSDHFYHAHLGELRIAGIMLRDLEGEDAR